MGLARSGLSLTFLGVLGACVTAPPPAAGHNANRAGTTNVSAATAPPEVGDLGKVGHVVLPTSCAAGVTADLQRGVALLHSFFYEEARRVFTAVATSDPSCAMAQWGIAMTHWHPIWAAPEAADFESGRAAAERASALTTALPLERDLVKAIAAFYDSQASGDPTSPSQSCHGVVAGDIRGRALAYEQAMAQVHARHPEDVEPTAFYALALLATAPPSDASYANQRKATALLEPFFVSQPNHPGVAHYLIHGYDYPELAARALPAARAYAGMAPWVPHALHMPSHIFTRLGLWNDAIAANLSAASAARKYEARFHPGAHAAEELHALDYAAYGYLQTAQDGKAAAIVAYLGTIDRTNPELDLVAGYPFATIPARYALERRRWSEAAVLTPSPLAQRMPFIEANVVYARAIGAARSGNVASARADVERLGVLGEASAKEAKFAFFVKQVELQRKAGQGWLLHAEHREIESLAAMRAAVELEDAIGKHPVTTGAVLPAREQLGDLLLEQGQPELALAEHERSLATSPNRFAGLYGAARAADRAGDRTKARAYYEKLVTVASGNDERPELAEARAWLAHPVSLGK